MNEEKIIKTSLIPILKRNITKIVLEYFTIPEVLIFLESEQSPLPYNTPGGCYATIGILTEEEYFSLMPILETFESDDIEPEVVTSLFLNRYEQNVDIFLKFYTLNQEKIRAFKVLHGNRLQIGAHDLIESWYEEHEP